MGYNNIPILINGAVQYFNFDVTENDKGQVCIITAEDKQLVVDEDFAFISGDMPEDWQIRALEKLKQILHYSE